MAKLREAQINAPDVLHLMKLAVGARDVAQVRAWQAARLQAEGDLRHRTRQFPRRAAEIVRGGSMYWVIAGMMTARQRVLEIVEDQRPDGQACAALVLEPELTLVEPRPVRAFQGWRYLAAAAAPADLAAVSAAPDALPPALRSELRALCLI